MAPSTETSAPTPAGAARERREAPRETASPAAAIENHHFQRPVVRPVDPRGGARPPGAGAGPSPAPAR